MSMVTYAAVTPGRLILDVRTTHSTHIRLQGSHLLMKFAVMQPYSSSLSLEEIIDFLCVLGRVVQFTSTQRLT